MPALKIENIAPLVHAVRGERVLFDADLAALYGVSTKAVNQAVKRNRRRFPTDFMFRLTDKEWSAMRSQFVTASPYPAMMSQFVTSSRRNIVAAPYAFTEQGVAMLSSVLRSPRAVEVNIAQFAVVFNAIKRLIAEESARKTQPRRSIGFTS